MDLNKKRINDPAKSPFEKTKPETVMVTGSDGFIGGNLVRHLRSIGKEVIPIDAKSGTDLPDKKNIENLPDTDFVIHLAGNTYVPSGWADPHSMYDININTTLNMLEFSRRRKVRKFVYPSTYLYGNPQYVPTDEKHPVCAANPYTRSKWICEEMCKAYSEDYGVPVLILRLFNVYGSGQADFFLISRVLSQLSLNTITLNDPNPKRDYLYISDVVRAFQMSLESSSSNFEIFNIGSGVNYRVTEVVDLILKIAEVECDVIYKNEGRKNEVMESLAGISKAKKLLGWEPRIQFEEGLRSMMATKK
ncbi:MAG: GDP-mannose 4,6-dehydratase [Deltaproteobacteria bacterium]|nr:GDP-mannose 4,6-dehydratase [Deltaproteobacteria bacterium]